MHVPLFTLENPRRETIKDSLIPAGIYKGLPYSSPRHPNAFAILGVPGRSNILIHVGNVERDTTGCILVGLSAGTLGQMPAVKQSKDALLLLHHLLGENGFQLQIVDALV